MTLPIESLKKTRHYLVNLLDDVSIKDYNKIPVGFNNNIIWNVGHLIASQQGICYVRSGAKIVVNEKYFLPFKPGTKPEQDVAGNEIEIIKDLLLTSVDKLNLDYRNNFFANYPSWSTRYGVEITNIDDALQFLLYHEGLHAGTIISMKRLLQENEVNGV